MHTENKKTTAKIFPVATWWHECGAIYARKRSKQN